MLNAIEIGKAAIQQLVNFARKNVQNVNSRLLGVHQVIMPQTGFADYWIRECATEVHREPVVVWPSQQLAP